MDQKKYKVGYTTGVYDMFHIGHLNILKKAKERCEYLIVGVSTDEVVESYKHRAPIIPFEERIAIISELRCVDRAVPQTSMDKMEAWKKLHFDALFHGSDWKGSDMYNKMIEEFARVGVDVVFLPHTEGVSSTLLSEVLYTLKEEAEESEGSEETEESEESEETEETEESEESKETEESEESKE